MQGTQKAWSTFFGVLAPCPGLPAAQVGRPHAAPAATCTGTWGPASGQWLRPEHPEAVGAPGRCITHPSPPWQHRTPLQRSPPQWQGSS